MSASWSRRKKKCMKIEKGDDKGKCVNIFTVVYWCWQLLSKSGMISKHTVNTKETNVRVPLRANSPVPLASAFSACCVAAPDAAR